MDKERIKNISIYETNKEDLYWLKQKSFLNEYPYYGRLNYLTNKKTKEQQLCDIKKLNKIFSIEKIDTLLFFYTNYIYNKTFNNGMLVINQINFLLDDLIQKENFISLMNNTELLIIYSELYQIFHDIEKNEFSKVLHRLRGIRWPLWPEKFLRDYNEKENIKIRPILKKAEHGLYREAFDEINNLNNNEIKMMITNFYYRLILAIKLNKKLYIKKIYKEFTNYINDNKEIENFWNVTLLKISLFYLNYYEYSHSKKSLELYKKYYYMALQAKQLSFSNFDYISKQILLNTKNDNLNYIIKERNFNIELIREYFLNMLTYLYIEGILK